MQKVSLPGDEVFGVGGEAVEVAAEPSVGLGGRDLQRALVNQLPGRVEHVQLNETEQLIVSVQVCSESASEGVEVSRVL